MKRMLTAAAGLLMTIGFAASASAQGVSTTVKTYPETPTAEIGFEAGFPTGITAKFWTSPLTAVQVGAARQFSTTGYMLTADYLWHSASLAPDDRTVRMPLYIGAGARYINFDHGGSAIGPRVPIGVEAMLRDVPLAFYGELAPALEVGSGSPTFTADADVGARITF